MFGGDGEETGGREGQTPGGTRAERARSRDDGIGDRRGARGVLRARGGAVPYPEMGVSLFSVARCTESAMSLHPERAAFPSPFCRSPARHPRPITPPP